MEELTTTSEVMDALGGTGPVAALTRTTTKAAWNWRGFETFPSNTYVVMTNALRHIGKRAPASLWGMKMPAPSSEEAA